MRRAGRRHSPVAARPRTVAMRAHGTSPAGSAALGVGLTSLSIVVSLRLPVPPPPRPDAPDPSPSRGAKSRTLDGALLLGAGACGRMRSMCTQCKLRTSTLIHGPIPSRPLGLGPLASPRLNPDYESRIAFAFAFAFASRSRLPLVRSRAARNWRLRGPQPRRARAHRWPTYARRLLTRARQSQRGRRRRPGVARLASALLGWP